MKTAILGWGSLLWQPKDLQFDKEIGWSENLQEFQKTED